VDFLQALLRYIPALVDHLEALSAHGSKLTRDFFAALIMAEQVMRSFRIARRSKTDSQG